MVYMDDNDKDNDTDNADGQQKLLSASTSRSSTLSCSSSATISTTSSSSTPSSHPAPPLMPDETVMVVVGPDYLAAPEAAFMDEASKEPLTTITTTTATATPMVQQEDIKEVQIETEDPSHLFWVPFHLHPEIAPNEYNKWLSKHGVDSSGDGSLLAARKESLNRRKSVLSAQYNPEEDEDEDEEKEKEDEGTENGNRAKEKDMDKDKDKDKDEDKDKDLDQTAEHDSTYKDFLSGVFSVPLAQMGEPPLKTKTSLRRSTSRTQPMSEICEETIEDMASDMAAEDLAAVKRGTGLTRHGPSLLRRSARTKIRRNSTASTESRHDVSRMRPEPIENGEYPAITLVDPGPLPLPSPLSSSATVEPVLDPAPVLLSAAANTDETTREPKDSRHMPLKRFVSTLRDSSKPTITTYVEPQLLEQRQKDEDEDASRSTSSHPTSTLATTTTTTTTTTTVTALAHPDTLSHPSLKDTPPSEHDASLTFESAIVSKITYPIPPPVKLSQNLLQQPKQPIISRPPLPTKQLSSSPPQQQQQQQSPPSPPKFSILPSKASTADGVSPPQSVPKKSSSWSWFWGKEKNGDKAIDMVQNPSTPSFPIHHAGNTSNSSGDVTVPVEAAVKKPSALSLLFSRNSSSKASTKVQPSGTERTPPSSFNVAVGQMSSSSSSPLSQDYLRDPSRMPLHIERAIYRLSHIKLANPRRPLHEQVLISNMMFWYLGVIQQQQLQQQHSEVQQQQEQQEQQHYLKQLQQEQQQPPQSPPLPQQQLPLAPSSTEQDVHSKIREPVRISTVIELRKDSEPDGLTLVETKIEGSEYVVPLQDSNSHARSPIKEAAIQTTLRDHHHHHHGPSALPREEDAEYDEESMIGGGFSEDFDWSDEDEDAYARGHDHDGMNGAGSLYLQGRAQVPNTFSLHTMPATGPHSVSARGPKKHLKRLNAPKHWMLDKLTGVYAPRPTAGPHKLRECLPLVILLRNRLKYALNGKEVQSILMQRLVKVDNKVRTDSTFPAGFMDAITIEKTGENFRLVYDTKGRFTVHRITAEEAKYKLCKVKKVQLGSKGIPFVVTHDGRTLRYPDPLIKVNDTVKLDLETGKFAEFVKFEVGNVAMVTGGRNTGRVGVITHRERHVGGFDIVHIKDVLDRQFATRLTNVFVIGEGNKPWVSLPKNKGVKLTIAEERDRRRAAN
ncbi:40S ribosomal protein S4 [Dissophora globulifera]|uniref:40S ribosomal protein S4 n=1 Tax=Dissophora globulifera TaxID=979702 RepID=A0A9P6R447_9FUNG|nr:40S ribosomal protein S4 [Dissophora globulifera]